MRTMNKTLSMRESSPYVGLFTALAGLLGFWVSRKWLHKTPVMSVVNGVGLASSAYAAMSKGEGQHNALLDEMFGH